MKVIINNQELEIFIIRKKSNKNTYLRLKEDFNIYVTTNYWTSEKEILKLIEENKKYLEKMLLRRKKQVKSFEEFSYLGKKYDVIILNTKDIILGEDKIFVSKKDDLEKWLRKKAELIFKNELDKIYNIFPVSIPYPSLTIRKMTTRWGVCNVKTKRVTLNLELIKKDLKYLDYVIVHELSHLIYANHSKDFWNLVSMVEPNYKQLRKELNNYE